jgi:unsaturated chondroitin disaccharide hydrolase
MPIRAAATGGILALATLVACSSPTPQAPAPAKPSAVPSPDSSRVFQYTEQRLLDTDAALAPDAYPTRTKPDGTWDTAGPDDWTAGFFPGTLWQTFERTQDPAWRQRAETRQAPLATQTKQDSTDLGFKFFNTYGKAYRITKDEAYKRVVLEAAGTVGRRYDPEVKAVRVWENFDDKTQFRTNIDAMMDMEILFWAGQNGGDPKLAEMARQNSVRAMQDLVRPDGSTWMVGNYDQNTGALQKRSNERSLATETTWSRGQAWAVYGFTMAYRYTKDPRFLDTARRTADWFIGHLPADKVPYFDFDAPDKATAPRDTSAAAIAASGLLELNGYQKDPAVKKRYTDAARDILTSLSSPTYSPRTPFAAMLQHGTQNFLKKQVDQGLVFSDYYFVEALGRYEKAGNSTATLMPE